MKNMAFLPRMPGSHRRLLSRGPTGLDLYFLDPLKWIWQGKGLGRNLEATRPERKLERGPGGRGCGFGEGCGSR